MLLEDDVLPSVNSNLVCERKILFSHLRMPSLQFSGPAEHQTSEITPLSANSVITEVWVLSHIISYKSVSTTGV